MRLSDRIMRLLSPVTDIPNPSYAAEWRARVAAHKKAAAETRAKRAGLRPGSIVTLERAGVVPRRHDGQRFPHGLRAAQNADLRTGRPSGFWCRLSAASLAAAAIAQADAAAVAG